MALSVPEQLVLSFDVSASVARLFVTLYLAGYAIALIPMGIGCDVFPRKWFVLSCLLAFAALGLLASTSDSLVTILLVRFVQGVLGAACAVGARAIIRDIAGVDIAKSMTSMMIILALSPSVGPLLQERRLILRAARSICAKGVRQERREVLRASLEHCAFSCAQQYPLRPPAFGFSNGDRQWHGRRRN